MTTAVNSGGIGLVNRHKEQTWVPVERPGCSKPPSMAAHNTKHLSRPGWDKGGKRMELYSAPTWYYGNHQQSNLVPQATPKFSLSMRFMGPFQKKNLSGLRLSLRLCCQAVLENEVSNMRVAASSVDEQPVKVKKVKVKVVKKLKAEQEHVGRSLQAIGVRNATLAKCVIEADGMTEEEMLEWMSMLQRLGVKHSEIVSMVGKDASVLRAHIPDVERLWVHLKDELDFDRSIVVSMCMQWPGLLLCSVQHVNDVTNYLLSVGLELDDVQGVFQRRPHVLSHSVERIQCSVQCLLQAGVLVQDLAPILRKVPELFSDLTQRNLDSKLEFLLKVGLGAGSLGKAIARRPNILNYNLDSMRVAFQYLETLMRSRDVPRLVKRYAEVLVLDPERKMAPMVNYLISLGVQRDNIGKVILKRPQLLGYTIPGLQPTVQYLIELGVKPESLGKVVSTSPQVLTLNVEEKLKPVVEFFSQYGIKQGT